MAWPKPRNHHDIPAFLLVKSWTAACLLHFIKAFKEGETLRLVMAGGLFQSQKMSLLSLPRWVYSPKSWWPWYMESDVLFSGLLLWTHLVGCLFILLTVSFDMQKLLVLCSLGCFYLLPLILVSDPTKLTAQVFFQFYRFSSFTHCKLIVCVVWHMGSSFILLNVDSPFPGSIFGQSIQYTILYFSSLMISGWPLLWSLAPSGPKYLSPWLCWSTSLHLTGFQNPRTQFGSPTLHISSPPLAPTVDALNFTPPLTSFYPWSPVWSSHLCLLASALMESSVPWSLHPSSLCSPRLAPSQNPGPVHAWPPLLPLPSELPPGRSLSSLRPACHLGTELSSLL